MKNSITCSNCNAQNPFYALNCVECKAYLRSRVVNIDLWQFIGTLIESPSKGFTNIVYAENKNFIIIVALLAGIKFFFNSIIFSHAFGSNINSTNHIVTNLFLSQGYLIALILLISFLVTCLNNLFGFINRFKDNLALYVFSLIPLIIAMLFLVPVEFALFGTHWFNFNPPPYIIKPMATWVLFFIEGLMVLWSVLLTIIATFIQTRNKLYSAFVGIMIIVLLFIGMIILPLYPF